MVRGTRADAEALREDIAAVLATMGLRLSPDKTLITHIDEGLDFLGWRIQRHRKRGTSSSYVYVHPSHQGRVGGQTEDQDATANSRTEPAAR